MWDVMGKMALFRVMGDEGDRDTHGCRGSMSAMGGQAGCCWQRQERWLPGGFWECCGVSVPPLSLPSFPRVMSGEKLGCFTEWCHFNKWQFPASILPGWMGPGSGCVSPHRAVWPLSFTSTPNATTHHVPVSWSDKAGGTVPQGHRLAVVGPLPNPYLSNGKGNREKNGN